MPAPPPLFSIGVTTYRRRELLRQLLLSIRDQSFGDFEVLIGNDDTSETISGSSLGVEDSRFRFLNHPKNLGEVGNMNALLAEAQGRYFTWMADDDVYQPDYLDAIRESFSQPEPPSCVYTGFGVFGGAASPARKPAGSRQHRPYSGRDFLLGVLQGKLRAIGPYGVFETESLRRLGGFERMCDANVALFAEYMLLIRVGQLPRVDYIDAPLVLYRAHEQSWGYANFQEEIYRQAGENLICKSAQVLASAELREDFRLDFTAVLKLVFSHVILKMLARFGLAGAPRALLWLLSVRRLIHKLPLDGFHGQAAIAYWSAVVSVGFNGIRLVWAVTRARFSRATMAELKSVPRGWDQVFERK